MRRLLAVALLSAASLACAAGVVSEQAALASRIGGQRQTECETRVAPMMGQLMVPELLQMRPDIKPVVRCWALYYVNHAQMREQWRAGLKAQGYQAGAWEKKGSAWHLIASRGDVRGRGSFALTNSIYAEVTKEAGLITFMGVESLKGR